jgi:hypothetical protein
MTDEEVNEIYDGAYDFLSNTRYIIAELRADYLLDKRTSEE